MNGIFSGPSYLELAQARNAMQVDGVPDEGETMVHAIRDYMHLRQVT